MSARRSVGLACFLLGMQVGAALLYLVQHRDHAARPLCLAVFVLTAFTTLAVADRLLAPRPVRGRPGAAPSAD